MSDSENLAIVKQLYEVIEKGEYSLLSSLLNDDIQWHGMTLEQQLSAQFLQDIPSVVRFFESGDRIVETHWLPEIMMPQGDSIVVIGKSHHTSKITDYCFENKWVHILSLRQGKIAEFQSYLDPVTLLGAFN